MPRIVGAIEVDVPVSTVYAQWAQFESFSQFLDDPDRITPIDDTHQHWKVKVGGSYREFDTVITERRTDESMAWRTTGGESNHVGLVTFEALGSSTRVSVQIDWEPMGAMQALAARMGAGNLAVKRDLANFKQYIESVATQR
ncbi:SRPBCC family protein [Homoserinibacter sp. GY 40078]|uniref:SRPBCC family protein n=1 Tax=Homoserinibacter sp. GY 40078 TaxID=2603275 RepID=UPI0011C8B128|nr:SRPBCC family protein [Homoserinibacter sp. GY 40078]TXK17080.1 SRPBCC family protein [Homoserinibacter sp. GY 40078]